MNRVGSHTQAIRSAVTAVENWLDQYRAAAAHPDVAPLVEALQDSLDQRGKRLERPLIVALMGGTGVGKSLLFSVLVERPDASPSSPTRRAYTTRPVAALAPRQQSFLQQELLDLEAERVSYEGPIILFDTPDIDTEIGANSDRALQVMELADIVVFVTSPEKQNDRVLVSKLKALGPKKRWLFVGTKADTLAADQLEEYKSHLVSLYQTLGFSASSDTTYLVSSLAPERFDFALLKQRLFRVDWGEYTQLFDDARFLAYAEAALSEEALAPLGEVEQSLTRCETTATTTMRQFYQRHLTGSAQRRHLKTLIHQESLQRLAQETSFPVALYFWLAQRFFLALHTFNMSRYAVSGNPLGTALAALQALQSLVRGALPYQKLAAGLVGAQEELHQDLARGVEVVFRQTQAALLLEEPLPTSIGEKGESKALPWWLKRVAPEALTANLNTPRSLLDEINRLVEGMAEQLVAQVLGRSVEGLLGRWQRGALTVLMVVIPWLFIADATIYLLTLWGIPLAWLWGGATTRAEMSVELILVSLFMIIASALPAFLVLRGLLLRAMKRSVAAPGATGVVIELERIRLDRHEAPWPVPLEPLRQALTTTVELLADARQLRQQLSALQQRLEREGASNHRAFQSLSAGSRRLAAEEK